MAADPESGAMTGASGANRLDPGALTCEQVDLLLIAAGRDC